MDQIHVGRHGKILNEDQVRRHRRDKGLCVRCGVVKTHRVKLMGRRALNNAQVDAGVCRRCRDGSGSDHGQRSSVGVNRAAGALRKSASGRKVDAPAGPVRTGNMHPDGLYATVESRWGNQRNGHGHGHGHGHGNGGHFGPIGDATTATSSSLEDHHRRRASNHHHVSFGEEAVVRGQRPTTSRQRARSAPADPPALRAPRRQSAANNLYDQRRRPQRPSTTTTARPLRKRERHRSTPYEHYDEPSPPPSSPRRPPYQASLPERESLEAMEQRVRDKAARYDDGRYDDEDNLYRVHLDHGHHSDDVRRGDHYRRDHLDAPQDQHGYRRDRDYGADDSARSSRSATAADAFAYDGRDLDDVLSHLGRALRDDPAGLARGCAHLRRRDVAADRAADVVDLLCEAVAWQEDHASVLEHALAALWSLAARSARHRDVAGERALPALVEEGGLARRAEEAGRRRTAARWRIHLCGLYGALSRGRRHRRLLTEARGVETLSSCLTTAGGDDDDDRWSNDVEALVATACKALVVLIEGDDDDDDDDDDLAEQLHRVCHKQQLVPRVVAQLKEHCQRPAVAEPLLVLLWTLVKSDASFSDVLVRAPEGIEALVSASRLHADRSFLQIHVNVILCASLQERGDDDDVAVRLRRSVREGLPAVLAGMGLNTRNARLQRLALVVLCQLAEQRKGRTSDDDDDAARRRDVVRDVEACYGLDVLGEVLEENLGDDTVRRLACGLLRACSESLSPDALVAAEVPRTVIAAWRHDRSDAVVEEACLHTLWNASRTNDEVLRVIVEGRGITPLTKCLLGSNDVDGDDKDKDERRLEKSRVGCHLLADVAARHRTRGVDLVLALCNAVAKHGDDADVVTQAFRGIGNVVLQCHEDLPPSLVASVRTDMVVKKIKAFRNHDKDKDVTRAALFLLAALVRYAPEDSLPRDVEEDKLVSFVVSEVVRSGDDDDDDDDGGGDADTASRALDLLGQIAHRSRNQRAILVPVVLNMISDAVYLFQEHAVFQRKAFATVRTMVEVEARRRRASDDDDDDDQHRPRPPCATQFSSIANAVAHVLTSSSCSNDTATLVEGFRTLTSLLGARDDGDGDGFCDSSELHHDRLAAAVSAAVLAHPADADVLRAVLDASLAHDHRERVSTPPRHREVLEIVLDALNACDQRRDAETTERLAATLCNWATDPVCRETMVTSSGYSVVIEVMTRVRDRGGHPTDSDAAVLTYGCTFLSHVVADNVEVALGVFYTEGVDAVLHALATFPRRRDVALESLTALSRLCVTDDVRRVVVRYGGGVGLVAAAIDAHPDDRDVAVVGCRVLRALARRGGGVTDDAAAASARRPDASGVALRAARRWPDSASVARDCLGASAVGAARDPGSLRALAAERNVRWAVDALSTHGARSARTQRYGTEALRLVCALEVARVTVLDGDGVAAVLDGMMAHVDVAAVQISCCRLLSTLCRTRDAQLILRNGERGVEEILITTRRHYDDAAVKAAAQHCLACVLAETEPALMYQASEEELRTLWDPMPLLYSGTSPDVWESFCAVLANLCVTSDDRTTNHDNVDLVRRTLPDVHASLFDAEERFDGTCRRAVQRVLEKIVVLS